LHKFSVTYSGFYSLIFLIFRRYPPTPRPEYCTSIKNKSELARDSYSKWINQISIENLLWWNTLFCVSSALTGQALDMRCGLTSNQPSLVWSNSPLVRAGNTLAGRVRRE
jgi:hypothetical protein